MRGISLLILLACALALPGCLAKTALDVATAPVKVAGKAVDMATTSQSEADEKRGRELRMREEELGKLERQYDKLDAKCRDGDERACLDMRNVYAEMEQVRATLPQHYD